MLPLEEFSSQKVRVTQVKHLAKIRLFLLRFLRPLIIFLGNVHMPFSRKKIKGRHYLAVKGLIKPGMVIVTNTHGELTSALIPGKWSHTGIYVGNDMVIEATGSGVVKTDLITFMLTKDEITLVSPIFADSMQRLRAAQHAEYFVGKSYDYDFNPNNDAFYCSELVIACYSKAFNNELPFEVRERFGTETVTPDDIVLAERKWLKVWAS